MQNKSSVWIVLVFVHCSNYFDEGSDTLDIYLKF